MEKRKPHCPLPVVQALANEGKVRATMSAVAGANALGFDFDEMVSVVVALTSKDFYKSMTTHEITGNRSNSEARRGERAVAREPWRESVYARGGG